VASEGFLEILISPADLSAYHPAAYLVEETQRTAGLGLEAGILTSGNERNTEFRRTGEA
jgi:hypothetical protein